MLILEEVQDYSEHFSFRMYMRHSVHLKSKSIGNSKLLSIALPLLEEEVRRKLTSFSEQSRTFFKRQV